MQQLEMGTCKDCGYWSALDEHGRCHMCAAGLGFTTPETITISPSKTPARSATETAK